MARFTKDVRETIIDSIRHGVGLDRAAELAGVDRKTFYRWRKRGEDHIQAGKKSNYAEFARNINKLRARTLSLMEKSVLAAAARDWKAGAWYLERTLPDEYGKKEKLSVQVDGEVQKMIEALEPWMTDDAYEQLLYGIAKIKGIDLGLGELSQTEDAATVH